MSDSDTNAGDADDAGEPSDSGDPTGSGDAGFDKEAEREKLREKFARDEEKRESTRRMSELLLKGATMTNRHCDTCGDPLFRQNDQEFCATCRAEPPADEGVDAREDATGVDATPTRQAEGSTDENDESTGTPRDEQSNDGPAGRTAATPPTARRGATDQRRTPPSQTGPDAQTNSTPSVPTTTPTEASGELGDARDALVAALTRHATAGGDTDDPRTARDHLAAAREAAEALSALRR